MLCHRLPLSRVLVMVSLLLIPLLIGCELVVSDGGPTRAAQGAPTPTSPAARSGAAAQVSPSPSPALSQNAPKSQPLAATTPVSTAPAGTNLSLVTAVRQVADARKPAVVLIANVAGAPGDALLPVPQQQGIGSGVIFDPAGYILTNNHVVEGAQRLRVALPPPDNRTFEGTLVGRDPRTDLAVVKIEGDNLPVAPLAPQLNVAVGDWVVAIGNALGLEGGPTVTAGVVGALDRTIEEPNGVSLYDLIQTDAAINPGNSGGPLLNLAGEVVGINTAGIRGAEGLGFAVSITTVHEVVPQLIQHGRVIRPFMGVSIVAITPGIAARFNLPTEEGLLVVSVGQGTPAARAGLREGDILLAADGQPLETEQDLRNVLSRHQPGDTITVTVQRDSARQDVRITLGESPAPR